MRRAIVLPLLATALLLGATACGGDPRQELSRIGGSSAPSGAAGVSSPGATPSASGQTPAAAGTPQQPTPVAQELTTVYFVHTDW